MICVLPQVLPAFADWQAVEKVQTYPISGDTGVELYKSIGEHGPKISETGRTIAHTTFKLTWTRRYVPQGTACVLVTAVPKLIITYTLPKPATKLPAPVQGSWDTFAAGIAKHEHVHGESIKQMVHDIEKMSIGFSAPDDPDCKKVRVELTKRLAELSAAQRQRDRDFDATEMSKGGNIQQLILALANGP
jgi:predicted secreted Zn-dependent protease